MSLVEKDMMRREWCIRMCFVIREQQGLWYCYSVHTLWPNKDSNVHETPDCRSRILGTCLDQPMGIYRPMADEPTQTSGQKSLRIRLLDVGRQCHQRGAIYAAPCWPKVMCLTLSPNCWARQGLYGGFEVLLSQIARFHKSLHHSHTPRLAVFERPLPNHRVFSADRIQVFWAKRHPGDKFVAG